MEWLLVVLIHGFSGTPESIAIRFNNQANCERTLNWYKKESESVGFCMNDEFKPGG